MSARSRASFRAFAELALAVAALVGAGLSWSHAQRTMGVGPIADGQQATTQLVFDPQLLLLTLLLATIAGVFAVLGAARWRRSTPSS